MPDDFGNPIHIKTQRPYEKERPSFRPGVYNSRGQNTRTRAGTGAVAGGVLGVVPATALAMSSHRPGLRAAAAMGGATALGAGTGAIIGASQKSKDHPAAPARRKKENHERKRYNQYARANNKAETKLTQGEWGQKRYDRKMKQAQDRFDRKVNKSVWGVDHGTDEVSKAFGMGTITGLGQKAMKLKPVAATVNAAKPIAAKGMAAAKPMAAKGAAAWKGASNPVKGGIIGGGAAVVGGGSALAAQKYRSGR